MAVSISEEWLTNQHCYPRMKNCLSSSIGCNQILYYLCIKPKDRFGMIGDVTLNNQTQLIILQRRVFSKYIITEQGKLRTMIFNFYRLKEQHVKALFHHI